MKEKNWWKLEQKKQKKKKKKKKKRNKRKIQLIFFSCGKNFVVTKDGNKTHTH